MTNFNMDNNVVLGFSALLALNEDQGLAQAVGLFDNAQLIGIA
ncbi:MAG: hypothetical protein ACI9DG_001683 [Oleispira sp.]|jgi:hypothetical protein